MIRVLTVADLHQSRLLYRLLARAVAQHQPDVVAVVGDCLDFCAPLLRDQGSTKECADLLSHLPVEHLVFVRGNHEDANWWNFVHAWPMQKRPLVALHGTALAIGPLVLVGFPCYLGSEETWCQALPKTGNQLTLDPTLSGRDPLPVTPQDWLGPLLRQAGPAGRSLWLMHEPPVALPLAHRQSCNHLWTDAVDHYRPLIVVSGHDHSMPLRNHTWHAKLGDSVCANAGQAASDLHYCLLDFEFAQARPGLPAKVTVRAFPWEQQMEIVPH